MKNLRSCLLLKSRVVDVLLLSFFILCVVLVGVVLLVQYYREGKIVSMVVVSSCFLTVFLL